jgi:hypothetical protein
MGATVSLRRHGDGTASASRVFFWLEIEMENGQTVKVVSTHPGRPTLARALAARPVRALVLRALQEEFDARLYPYGWTTAGFAMDGSQWLGRYGS